MSKLLFLSHIHEERKLAQLLQQAIEDEFGGFVTVFVSSDGYTIPAGSNFLKRIEQGLTECVGALYLISPKSVNRNWINFELGAIWIRNHISQLADGPDIPAIPICHSDMLLQKLPRPIGDLNAIQGNNATQLEFVFKSLQTAVGGRGRLKTDFTELAHQVQEFETEYTIGTYMIELFTLTKITQEQIKQSIDFCDSLSDDEAVTINLKMVDNKVIERLIQLEEGPLKDKIQIKRHGSAFMDIGNVRSTGRADIYIIFRPSLIRQAKMSLMTMM